MRHLKKRHPVFVLIALISSIFFVPITQAQGPNSFGSGIDICTPPIQPMTLVNPTTITNCTQAGVQAALNSGGHINFDCGPNQVIIPLNSALNLSTTTDTVLDGGGGRLRYSGRVDFGCDRIRLYTGWRPGKLSSRQMCLLMLLSNHSLRPLTLGVTMIAPIS